MTVVGPLVRSSRSRLARSRLPLLAAALPALTACVTYRPVPSSALAPGANVRVTLAEQGTADMTRFLGPRAAWLEGRVVSGVDSGLTLSVSTVARVNGVEENWPGDQVAIPRSAIGVVETRRLSRGRTAAFTAAGVAVLVLIAQAFKSSEGISNGGGRPGGGNPQ